MTPSLTPRVVRISRAQAAGYHARVLATHHAQQALTDFTAGVLAGHGIVEGTVTGFDPDARTLHLAPDAAPAPVAPAVDATA